MATEGTEVKATDAAQRKAEELGVDLTRVTGTGADGQIKVEDVEGAAQSDGATHQGKTVGDAGAQSTEETTEQASSGEKVFEVNISPLLGGNVDHVTIDGADYHEGQPLAESEFERLGKLGKDTEGHQMIRKGRAV